MNKINSTQPRESNNSYNSCDKSDDGKYEKYGRRSSAEEYTPYKENGQADEAVYDRYDTDYEGDETRDQGGNLGSKKSCCKKGRLFNSKNKVTDSKGRFSRKNFLHKNSLFQGFSLAKSNEYSTAITILFFADSESTRAKRFQDRNSMFIFIIWTLEKWLI